MANKILTIEDFKKSEDGLPYLIHEEDNFDICLEPCLNGFDVAIYDKKQNLLEDKKCTDIEDIRSVRGMLQCLRIVDAIVNDIYERYYELTEKDFS